MNKNLISLISICLIVALLPFMSALSNFPTVNLGPTAGSSGGVLLYVNSSLNQTYNTFIYNITQVNNYTNNFTYYNNTFITNNLTNNITIFGANITNNITNNYYANMTNVAFTNQSTSWGVFNITASWINGLFNWVTSNNWLIFNGSTLSFNETKLNNSIVNIGLANGFNSTYNATYDATTNSWNGNYSLLSGSLNNASYLSTYNVTYDTTTNSYNGNISLLLGSLNNASYLSTYNISYDGALNNASYLSTYNITYDTTTQNLQQNYTTYKPYWYNTSIPDQAYADSKLITIYYNATSLQTVTGTPQGGLGQVQLYNGITYNVSEVASDFDVRINFTGVVGLNQFIIRYQSDPSETHIADIQLWDYTTSSWESYRTIGISPNFNVITVGIYDPANHLSGNLVQMRIFTTNAGGSTHKWLFDWITLANGPAIPTSGEVDPIYTADKAIYQPYWYNQTEPAINVAQNYTDSTNSSMSSWINAVFLKISDMFTMAQIVTMINNNMSQVMNNASYLSTYNATYASTTNNFDGNITLLLGALNNASYLSTYNITYDATTNSWNGNYSLLVGALNNASYLSTYNATYDKYAYNQTTPAIIYTDNTNSTMSLWINAIFLKITDMFSMADIVTMINQNKTVIDSSINTQIAGNMSQVMNNASYLSTYNATYDAKVSFDKTNVAYVNETNKFTMNQNFTNNNISNINYIQLQKKVGACDLTLSGSICSNNTGTYIIG